METADVIYGYKISRADRDKLLTHCREKFDMSAADYMRIVTRAILEDRISIQKPEDKTGVYNDRAKN